jgi:sigma-B regulation protein RsbU (phosphoserine phosphatase)
VPLGPYARLLLYSDGVFEVERPNGTMWTHQEFIDYVSALVPDDQPLLQRLLDHARQLRGQDMLADDYSFLDVRL